MNDGDVPFGVALERVSSECRLPASASGRSGGLPASRHLCFACTRPTDEVWRGLAFVRHHEQLAGLFGIDSLLEAPPASRVLLAVLVVCYM